MKGATTLMAALALTAPTFDEPFEMTLGRVVPPRGRWAVVMTSTVYLDACCWFGRRVTRHRSLRAARAFARRMGGRRRVSNHDTLIRARVRRWRRDL